MIDIHSHILPGWDDGAETQQESLQMLRIAADSGSTDIVATPHANSRYRYHPDVIQQRFQELRAAAAGVIRVHLGCDFHLSYENVQDALQNPAKFTINNHAYLMVELPDLVIPGTARNVLGRLRSLGIVPIITHPERNVALQDRLDYLTQWVEDGCLIQVTGQSLLGRFGPEAERSAHAMLRENLVHFIASDAHDCEDRPPRLDETYQLVTTKFGAERAMRLFKTNPAAVLIGEELTKPRKTEKRKWYEFLR